MGNFITSGGSSGTVPPSTGLSAGENLAINQAVMIDGADNQVMICTVAKAGQCIGIMKKAIAIGIAVELVDIALNGEIVDAIVGVAIVRGDRLSVQVLPGRLGPLNAALHTHVAFRISGTPTAGVSAAGGMNVLSEGSTGPAIVDGDRKRGLVLELASGAGADNLTCTTSSNGVVTGKIIAKALETNAVVGTTLKVLLISS